MAFNNAVGALTLNVAVTLVSLTRVRGAPVGIWEVVARVPETGNVTEVGAVIVKVLVNAPEVTRLPPSVSVDDPLFTPVPPLEPDSRPLQPNVMVVGLSKDVSWLPDKDAVMFVSFTALKAAPVTSIPEMLDHNGTDEAAPVPVCDRYCLVVVKFPASLDKVLAPEPYNKSPRI